MRGSLRGFFCIRTLLRKQTFLFKTTQKKHGRRGVFSTLQQFNLHRQLTSRLGARRAMIVVPGLYPAKFKIEDLWPKGSGLSFEAL